MVTLQQLHAVRDDLLGKYVTLGLQALETKQRLKGIRKRERTVLEDLVQVDQQIRRMEAPVDVPVDLQTPPPPPAD